MKPFVSFRFLITMAVCFLYTSQMQAAPVFDSSRIYFISSTGNDNNNGSLQHPWQTLRKINNTTLQPGDTVYLQGNDTLTGTVYLYGVSGTQNLPIIIRSYGKGKAVIQADNSSAIVLDSCSYLFIHNIMAIGSGRKNGNIKNGLAINNCHHVSVTNIDVSGFQKSGLLVHNSKDIEANNVYAQDNGFAGIYVSGEYGDKLHCSHIKITGCHAENNPGDPTSFGNHSGNGILAGFCTHVIVDSCVANNNGWDMPRKGNGPVGIWCYEADSITIQHCISYENKTSTGGEDGGGYDFDGGTTNSVIQYCLSYRNQGSAFGIFQYDGATPWHDNVIRYCVSEDDGSTSAAHASAYVWNSSHDSAQFGNFLFYNNTLYNKSGNAIAYSSESEHHNFRFFNNIFITSDAILRGDYSKDVFLGNDFWSMNYGFKIDSITSFMQWAKRYNKEQMNGRIQGMNQKPLFAMAGNTSFSNAIKLSSFTNYQTQNNVTLSLAAVDLQRLYNISTNHVDFNNQPIIKNGIGACLR